MSEATATKMVIWNCNLEGIEGISINMQIEDATGLVCGFSIDYENVEYTPFITDVEEFVKAIRKTPLKVGCYFSLREWNNPFYTTSTMPIYVEQHLYPQLKDLITK